MLAVVAVLLATGGPLGLRTQGPLRELFLDLTAADARPIDRPEIDVRWTVANTWNEPMTLQRGNDWANQELDEQADALTLRLKAPWPGFPNVWTALEWKLTQHWGGWTDAPIESWHSLVGAFNYQRSMYPSNKVRLLYADVGGRAFDVHSGTLAPGDFTARTQIALLDGPVAVAARLDLKLPIGSLSRAGGSGGADSSKDALLSSGMYADFRAHNQISVGLRRGRFSTWISEDFTPGHNEASVMKWMWVSNAPDLVVGIAFTQGL